MRESNLDQILTIILKRTGDDPVRAAIVLGSGLGGFADRIENAVAIPYTDLPGFPHPAVEGHAGRALIGFVGGVRIICFQGRAHLYEDVDPAIAALPIRTAKRLGAEILILSNAAGSLRPHMRPGSLMMIADHINFAGRNPLVGQNDADFGPRFVDMSQAYDPDLMEMMRKAAHAEGIDLNEGVYLWALGPNFETPAEVRAFRTLGADATGMSTVPECLVARHADMRVAGVSVITNLAAGIADGKMSHDETLAETGKAGDRFADLIIRFLTELEK
ncbi:MAG: purine-nucleoside phosphorylase [Pseudomonadota bacterium]|nr:purine-nucleoside phosphorylase [Pseudomonadota bacterium]